MNIVDILILVVLAFSLLAGMHKGLWASALKTLGFIGSWFGARMVYERIANIALSNTTLMAVLNQYLEPENFFASNTQAMTTVAEVVSGGDVTPGQILSVDKQSFTVQTGEGALRILELQLEGKKRMDAGAFLRGCTLTVGEMLG